MVKMVSAPLATFRPLFSDPVSGLPTGWPAGTLRRCRGPLLLLPHFLINALHAHIFETQAYLDALATPYRRG